MALGRGRLISMELEWNGMTEIHCRRARSEAGGQKPMDPENSVEMARDESDPRCQGGRAGRMKTDGCRKFGWDGTG